MALFHRTLIIESPLPLAEAWKKLMPVVKTPFPMCTNCGQALAGPEVASGHCARCGSSQPPPLPPQGVLQWAVSALSQDAHQFTGTVGPQGFIIVRIIDYKKNTSVPVVSGRFEPSGAGTRITVDIRFPQSGYLLLIGGTCLPVVVVSALGTANRVVPPLSAFAVAVFVIPSVVFLICWLSFRSEAAEAQMALERIWGKPR